MNIERIRIVPQEVESGTFVTHADQMVSNTSVTVDFLCDLPHVKIEDGDEAWLAPEQVVARVHIAAGSLAYFAEFFTDLMTEQKEWAEKVEKGEVDAPRQQRQAPEHGGYI